MLDFLLLSVLPWLITVGGWIFWAIIILACLPSLHGGYHNLFTWLRTFPKYNSFLIKFRKYKIIKVNSHVLKEYSGQNYRKSYESIPENKFKYLIRKNWINFEYMQIDKKYEVSWIDNMDKCIALKSVQEAGETFNTYVTNSPDAYEVVNIEPVV